MLCYNYWMLDVMLECVRCVDIYLSLDFIDDLGGFDGGL